MIKLPNSPSHLPYNYTIVSCTICATADIPSVVVILPDALGPCAVQTVYMYMEHNQASARWREILDIAVLENLL